MELTEDEVLQILRLLEQSDFDQLRLEMGGLKLEASRHGPIEAVPASSSTRAVKESGKTTILVNAKETVDAVPAGQIAKQESARDRATTIIDIDLIPIKAPFLGIFYTCPEVGKPPYVEVGSIIQPEDVVGLIEVMKLFNPVKAQINGQIKQKCVENGQMVEYGQILFLVKPVSWR